jgi:hypothetical protein
MVLREPLMSPEEDELALLADLVDECEQTHL